MRQIRFDRESDWGLPEIPRRSAALTGVTRDSGAVNEVVKEKAFFDDPISEIDGGVSNRCIVIVSKCAFSTEIDS